MNTTVEFVLTQWLRYRLRIAITALCLATCGLLTCLWISSYYSVRMHALGDTLIVQSWNGILEVNPDSALVGSKRQDVALYRIPYWPLVLLFGALSALPWVQWSRRYSLRAFLIIATLIAISLGVFVISN